MQERLYVVIDQSGSMKKMNDSVYKGVQELIDVCSDDTMIVIITFNNDVKFVETCVTVTGVLGSCWAVCN